MPATRQLLGNWKMKEEADYYRSDYPAGVLANVGGAGVVTRRGTAIEGDTDLTAEEILWFLMTGVKGSVTPTQCSSSGTANAGVTTDAGYLDDSRLTGGTALVVDSWIGATVTCDGKTLVVTSNTTKRFLGSWVGGTPTTGSAWSIAGLAYTWVFTPELSTAVKTIQTLTAEIARGDGTTNHYYGEAGHGMTSSFKMDWNYNQPAKLSPKVFARARQADTLTGGIVHYPSREALVSNLAGIAWDTTWAGLGGTPLTGVLRSMGLEVTTGYDADYVLEERTDADFGNFKVGRIRAKHSLLMEFDAVSAAKYANYRANDLIYLRTTSLGSLIAGGGGLRKKIMVDGCYRFLNSPDFQEDGDQVLMAAEVESVYAETGSKTLEFTVVNALSAIA